MQEIILTDNQIKNILKAIKRARRKRTKNVKVIYKELKNEEIKNFFKGEDCEQV